MDEEKYSAMARCFAASIFVARFLYVHYCIADDTLESIFYTNFKSQKNVFKKNPENKGKILTTGLWKYTRHPNYFGEALMWWSIWIISINFFHPIQTFISILSPITLTWLLTKVSGVPMLESKYKDNIVYQDYIKNTSAFFPKFW